ncbi:hypothetical protein AAXB25_33560 [Paenibacillus lautus]|uniref:hypothetical protein n=1 Tax=Paenibacillus lautus TaxID=1401 RepID=UPI003D2A66F1
MGNYKSDYLNYKELVWAVVAVALEKGLDQAIEEVLTFESFTRSEVLDIANVSLDEYKKDCSAAYKRELRIRGEVL